MKIEERLRNAIGRRCYSRGTEKAYVSWYKEYVRFHGLRHPAEMGSAEIRAFLNHLVKNKKSAASTVNQAVCALVFLYKQVLGVDLGAFGLIERPKKSRYVPVVLSKQEVAKLLTAVEPRYFLPVAVMYGGGLRLGECLSLRVKDIDFDRLTITIFDGKGGKGRVVPLPKSISEPMQKHLNHSRRTHLQDLQNGLGATLLPNAVHNKIPGASRQWIWQYVFQADHVSTDPKTGHRGRWHVFDTTLQRAVRAAAARAGITKRVGPHTLRHSFATHLVEDGVDIRKVQELLGHRSLNTTMIYVHIANAACSVTSPLDNIPINGLSGNDAQDVDNEKEKYST